MEIKPSSARNTSHIQNPVNPGRNQLSTSESVQRLSDAFFDGFQGRLPKSQKNLSRGRVSQKLPSSKGTNKSAMAALKVFKDPSFVSRAPVAKR